MSEPLLFISAGDPSGDNATGRVVEHLKSKYADLRLFGLGGPRLKALGQEQLAAGADLAVLGFWEVAKRYLFFRRLFHRCIDEIKERKPSAVVLVDYPGFNLRLARKLKPLGIPIIYYISPQVWAWGKKRLHQIQAYVDRMLVILPFEEEFYRQHGVKCDFTGHYLLEDIPKEYIGSQPPGNRQIALLPGSRPQEIQRMLQPMLETAELMRRKHGARAVVAGVRGIFDYEAACQQVGPDTVTIRYDNARTVVFESDIVLTASGTATLETGIIGRPMVVMYRTGFLTYQIARRLVTLDNIALVNLVLGERAVPELIQSQASPEALAAELGRYWADETYRGEVIEKLKRVPGLLGGSGASVNAAGIIEQYL